MLSCCTRADTWQQGGAKDLSWKKVAWQRHRTKRMLHLDISVQLTVTAQLYNARKCFQTIPLVAKYSKWRATHIKWWLEMTVFTFSCCLWGHWPTQRQRKDKHLCTERLSAAITGRHNWKTRQKKRSTRQSVLLNATLHQHSARNVSNIILSRICWESTQQETANCPD